MEVFLLRHGQTAGNKLKRYIGRTNEPLSPEGESAVSRPAAVPDVSRVYISPMLRAVQTAKIMFPDAELIPWDDLREMDFGVFDNKSADEMTDDPLYKAWLDSNCLDKCPEGESIPDFTVRVCRAFGQIAAEAEVRGEKEIVIVSHGGTMMALMSQISEPQQNFYHWLPANSGGWRAELKNGKLTDYEVI